MNMGMRVCRICVTCLTGCLADAEVCDSVAVRAGSASGLALDLCSFVQRLKTPLVGIQIRVH